MAQKFAPAEKKSTDISAASAAFCISVIISAFPLLLELEVGPSSYHVVAI